jgi:hypothetical protein
MRGQSPAARRQLQLFISSLLVVATLLAVCGRAAAETVPLPSGAAAGSSRSTELVSTSCPAAGNCVAVGSYHDSANATQGLIETESDGIWAASEAPTTGLGASYVGLTAVSCPSVGNCVAIGTYDNTSNTQQALLETETNGVWSGSELSLASIGYSGHEMDFNAVSCSGVGSCVAVGDYSDSSSYEQAFVASDSAGTWTASKVSMSGLGAGADPSAELVTVSCPAAGSCVAVGSYIDSSNHDQGLIDTETSGAWTASRVNVSALPSVATNPSLQLTSVSCPSAGDCTAVGRYTDASLPDGSWQGLVLSSSGAVWSDAAEFKLPANASFTNPSHTAQPGLGIDSVSCSSPGNCMAVGSYSATSANLEDALELTETNGSWATGVAATPPTAVYAPSPNEQLNSVVCLAQGPCTVLGIYTDSGGFTDAWVISQKGTATSAASIELTAAQTDGTATLSCSPSDYCAAAGYSQSAGTNFPFLLDPPGAPTSPSAQVGGTQAEVAWTTPADTGGLPITGYNTTANDLTDAGRGGQMQTVGTSGGPTFPGLTPGDSYTFTITPTSVLGDGIPVTTASVTVPSVTVPWTKAQLLASLSGLLAPKGTQSHLKKLRKTHGYTFTFKPLESGKVSVRWNQITGRGKHKRTHLVGSGSATTTGTTVAKVHVKLTAYGRRVVKSKRKLRLTATVTFASGTTSVARTHTFTLH